MTEPAQNTRRWVGWCAPLFAMLACGVFLWSQRRVDLNMFDEGFLWYGVQRTTAGEVPMRDFQAYDPGRYYWCAAFVPLLGDGILGVRTAAALFAALGVTLALLVAGRFARHAGELLVCALVLGLWLFPRHKLFEPALASAALWLAVRLLEDPTRRAYLVSGLFVGVSAFFGRNHALYAGLAFGLCALYLAWKRPELRDAKRFLALGLGTTLGLAPLAGMLLLVPGFAAGYWRSLQLVLENGANLPRPYPFPWRTDWSALHGWSLAGELALAAAFLLPFVVLPLGAFLALRSPAERLRERAVPLAAFFVGAFYVHHASVRSDAPHLAQILPPLLVLALALPSLAPWRPARPLAWSALVLVSALAASEGNWLLTRFRPGFDAPVVEHEVHGETLRVEPPQAKLLRTVQTFAAEKLPGDTPIWIVNQPTLYAVLGKAAPTWWLVFYWPQPEAEQREILRRLDERGVDWALVRVRATGDPEDKGFFATNRLVWEYLSKSFENVNLPGLPAGLQLFRRRT